MSSASSNIETIAIGDELLVGKISDTNSQFVARQLFASGLRLSRESVVADDLPAMTATLLESAGRAAAVVVFGGLGPTSDDKTAECAAKILKCEIVEDSHSKERLLSFLAKRKRPMNSASMKQVLYPAAAQVIPNPKGLAPGFYFKLGACTLFFLPGVPMEMEAMFLETVLPEIQKILQVEKLLSHTWRCLGIHESQVQEVMNPIEKKLPAGCYLGYRTSFPENHLTLYWAESCGKTRFENAQDEIREILKAWTYTEGDRDLEQVVVEELKKQNKTVALAESCTGGLTVQRLTRIPGASDVVWGAFVSYQIAAKDKMLDVKVATNEAAVSHQCSTNLATQAKKISGASISGAVTGYMGPTYSEADPIGTVYIAVLGKQLIEKKLILPTNDRYRAQWGASSYLLQAILQELLE